MTSASVGVAASGDARTDAALTPAGHCLSQTRLPHVKDAIGASATVASHEDHPRGHRQGRGIASRRREQHHGFSLPLLRNRGPVAHQIVLMRRDHPFLPSGRVQSPSAMAEPGEQCRRRSQNLAR